MKVELDPLPLANPKPPEAVEVVLEVKTKPEDPLDPPEEPDTVPVNKPLPEAPLSCRN
jgi:hypothetical protein